MEKGKSIYKLPEGWIWTTIGEIAVLSSGGTPSRANYTRSWDDYSTGI